MTRESCLIPSVFREAEHCSRNPEVAKITEMLNSITDFFLLTPHGGVMFGCLGQLYLGPTSSNWQCSILLCHHVPDLYRGHSMKVCSIWTVTSQMLT